MAKNLGAAVLALLDHDRVDLRAAAATVLVAVGAGEPAVEKGLIDRLGDSDAMVRRIALEGLVAGGASGLAPHLVSLLKGDDETLAERAAQVLGQQGASAEGALRKELGSGPVPARRAIAQLLLARGTASAVDAIVDQLGDPELGEQVLQLVRHELDGGDGKLADLVWKAATARAGDAGKRLDKELARVEKEWQKNAAAAGAAKGAKAAKKGAGAGGGGGASAAKGNGKAPPPEAPPPDFTRDPAVAPILAELTAALRLLGYLARPTSQALLVWQSAADRPRPVRFAAIAALRRIVAASEAKGTEPAIEALIEYADGDDPGIAQAAIDTLRGARIPEKLAKPFAALARSKNAAAQKLAMERLPAGGGAGAVKALIEALGGDDVPARDAAARGLAKAPEAVLPLTRALLAATDEQVARRCAGALRSHRGHVSATAIDELVAAAQQHLDLHGKGKATADSILLERVISETIADVAPEKHVELLFERARRLRRAGKPGEAFAALKPLLRSRADLDAAIHADDRFLLAVLGLKAAGQAILRAAHADDPVLTQFGRLAGAGYPVARNLAREKDVEDEEIYGLGFRLLESTDENDKSLGAELLQGILDERPRSKLGKAARNKLKLTGYLDD
ncbi:MAG TPA: HEAT repeat domain-containing protein [Kofleriaceae bacterium]|nr:HEAT repeat domain-containing protein [Kofleriaceae bacterium]